MRIFPEYESQSTRLTALLTDQANICRVTANGINAAAFPPDSNARVTAEFTAHMFREAEKDLRKAADNIVNLSSWGIE